MGTSHTAEVAAMSAVNHPNILRLHGKAMDPSQGLILVYEFIPRGDIKIFLTRVRQGEVHFPWRDRMRVAVGCAEALAAIHAHKFIHRDFKSANVLLREDLTPVVADFGVARTIEDWKTHVTTDVVGSAGYIDPVYFQNGQLSQKSDTYAFGIFLLELISGFPPISDLPQGEVHFPWRDRMRVALGCAKALATIHAHNIVHRDFKSSNELLREDLTPVVADFGLARTIDDWKTHVSTKVVGSMGYIDPIYFQTGQLSQKSDTFAFGVFLLELMSGCCPLSAQYQELRQLIISKDLPDPLLVMDPAIEGEWARRPAIVTPDSCPTSGRKCGNSTVHVHLSTAYHPQTDGQTERTNQTMEQLIRTTCTDPTQCVDSLPLIVFAYNNAHSSTTAQSLFYLNYGLNPMTPTTLLLVEPVRLGEVHFPWRDRMRVAVGCAEALAAIHAHKFIHRDFKSANVLLREKTHVTTDVVGSAGYIDPVYFQNGQLSQKSDTYAFGVFLLELISGFPPIMPPHHAVPEQPKTV
ncbi:hypothetical protein CLOM_g705 [Closterium sp. NIES-68]|nr:hypothetical protein CLOM_g705 [Closterium sp. NIES-68]